MSRVILAASAFALVLGGGAPAVMAQTADAPVAAPSTGLTEAEFEALANAFGQRMEGMTAEMHAAVTGAAGDTAKRDADLDAIEARYQPEAEAFASALEAFLNHQASQADQAAEAQAQIAMALAAALPQVRTIPQQVRVRVIEAAAAPADPAT